MFATVRVEYCMGVVEGNEVNRVDAIDRITENAQRQLKTSRTEKQPEDKRFDTEVTHLCFADSSLLNDFDVQEK